MDDVLNDIVEGHDYKRCKKLFQLHYGIDDCLFREFYNELIKLSPRVFLIIDNTIHMITNKGMFILPEVFNDQSIFLVK